MNEEHVARLKQGVERWNKWRLENRVIGLDLTRANLNNSDLSRADLTGAILHGAKMHNANLSGANLAGANLAGANLAGAMLQNTIFADVDLTTTIGLHNCVHAGPSAVDHRTLLRSGRSLPEVFLRGCGLPDALIAYLPSLLNAGPIQFYSVFISYSTLDQPFADRLHADLQSKGVRCWFAPHDMQAGKKIHEQIDEAIRVYDRLLLIVSQASMSSTWVKTEIAKARRKAQEQNRHVLFPLALVSIGEIRAWEQFDADIGDDAAQEIREFYIPDFSAWKTDHDCYAHEFQKLLTALKSED